MASVEQTVREFIVNNFLFGDAERPLADDDSLLEEGVVDSTGILELVFFLEDKYRIAIGQDEMVPANLDSIGKVAAFVGRKIAVTG